MLFLRLAASCDHFEESDAPLLGLYCDSVALAQQAAAAMQSATGAELKTWSEVLQRTTRSATALAIALKLSPRGRNHNFRSRAGRSGPGNAYDQLGLSSGQMTPWGDNR
jgi:hypothetical protein